MNKNDFLQELGALLSILDGKEQQDILAEYSQHIEMKIENGLSEAEAIKDFGDIRDLAGEILEAYHVNPDYKASGGRRGRMDGRRAAEKGRSLWQQAGCLLKKAGESIGHFFAVCLGNGAYAARKMWGFIRKPWKARDGRGSWKRKRLGFQPGEAGYTVNGYGKTEYRDAEYADAEYMDAGYADAKYTDTVSAAGGYIEGGYSEPEYTEANDAGPEYAEKSGSSRPHFNRIRQTSGRKRPVLAEISTYPGRICRRAGSFIGYLFSLCLYAALWCIRWAWNICMMFLALFSGIFTLLALFGFGVAVVWLAQGYPLAGISIIGLGTILCGGSVTFLCVSLIRLKGKLGSPAGQELHRNADAQSGHKKKHKYMGGNNHRAEEANRTLDGDDKGGCSGDEDDNCDSHSSGPDSSSNHSIESVIKEVQHA